MKNYVKFLLKEKSSFLTKNKASIFSYKKFQFTRLKNINELEQLIKNKIFNETTIEKMNYIKKINIFEKALLIEVNLNNEHRNLTKKITSMIKEIDEFKDFEIKFKIAQDTKNNEIQSKQNTNQNNKKNLSKIKFFIAVSSCKGGVGKSTVSVNIAASLKNNGFKVGIFDADIHGPSLPILLKSSQKHALVYEDDKNTIIPIMYEDMKLMSYGFAAPNKKAVVRGPIVSGIVNSLLLNTDWGELDYLIVDFPPGTGDIQLSLCQEVSFTGAVIVTTPQKLSFIDVIKGIEMFQDLKVPIIAAVENMSYYICNNCDTKHKIFGEGYLSMMKKQFGIEDSFSLPIENLIAFSSDNGSPFVFSFPETPTKLIYDSIAKRINSKITSDEYVKIVNPPNVFYNKDNNEINISLNGKLLKSYSSFDLRCKCICAGCIHELTGEVIINKDKIDKNVFPKVIEPKGNYAVSVVWSDGHRSSIYPYKMLLENVNDFESEKKTKI